MKNKNTVKIHILWYICLILRLFISLLPLIYKYFLERKNKNNIIYKISLINKYILLFIGLGFLYKSIFGSNDEIQFEKVFWHKTRMVHSLLFIIAAINFQNYKLSSFLLFSDVLFSIIYRFLSGHFKFITEVDFLVDFLEDFLEDFLVDFLGLDFLGLDFL